MKYTTKIGINLPDEFSGTYETKGVWNKVNNYFTEAGLDKTKWRLYSEFRCTGLMKLMTAFAPGMFKKQTLKGNENKNSSLLFSKF